jgi:hypothetical protein
MIPLDTSAAANEIQMQIIKNMTNSDRLKVALEISEFARHLAFARIETQCPGLSKQDVVRKYINDVLEVKTAIRPA